MKKIVILAITVILGFVVHTVLSAYKVDSNQGVGVDLLFGWQQSTGVITEGVQCAQGGDGDSYVRGLPFHIEKRYMYSCVGSGLSNTFAAVLNLVIAIGLVGCLEFVFYKFMKRNRL